MIGTVELIFIVSALVLLGIVSFLLMKAAAQVKRYQNCFMECFHVGVKDIVAFNWRWVKGHKFLILPADKVVVKRFQRADRITIFHRESEREEYLKMKVVKVNHNEPDTSVKELTA